MSNRIKYFLGILAAITINVVVLGQDQSEFQVVPTFNSAGIYWIPEDTSETVHSKTGEILFRPSGTTEWKHGFELYWLPREDGASEFRGSIVHLKPAQAYDLRINFGEQSLDTSFVTWDDQFKIKKTIHLDPDTGPFSTIEGGNDTDGYVVYEPLQGSDSVLDARRLSDFGIHVKHDWVIIRGWKIQQVRNYPVQLYPRAKHIVIEYCDISTWGELGKLYAKDSYGIYCEGENLIPHSIVIQYCYFHDPLYDTNNWSEPSDKSSAGNHPGGTQPIYLLKTGGRLVIRYNTISGSEAHYYNDGMGEWRNFGPHGFPYRDSDIHNNYISHCWDNAIEAEGGNINVRIYNNYTDSTYAHMGLSNITFGPLYLFNNVTNVAHKYPGDYKEGTFLKNGNKLKWDATTQKYWPCMGRAYVFNNTILQPNVNGVLNGNTGFTTSSGPANGTVYLNNIMHMSGRKGESNKILSANGNCLVNYNLYTGGYLEMTGAKNINNTPQYESDREGFYLTESSPGYENGVEIPNFLEDYAGKAPDMGAYQNGEEPIQFGCGFALNVEPGTRIVVGLKAFSSEGEKVKYYPNPFSDRITIELINPAEHDYNISLIDTMGRQVYAETFSRAVVNKTIPFHVNTDESLIDGLYILRVSSREFSKSIPVYRMGS